MDDVLYDPHTLIGAIAGLTFCSLITFAVLLVAWWWDHRKARRQEIAEPAGWIPDSGLNVAVDPEDTKAWRPYSPRRALVSDDTVEQEPVR